jgi:thiamine biosynthesis lipoprotein
MAEPASAFSVVTSDWGPGRAVHRFAHDAMATTFEVVILGEEAEYARQAAEAAFDEVDRLELELSRFIETSDVSRISGLGAGGSTRVGIAAFDCIELASRVHAETGGAFDVTVGALAELWSAAEGEPSEEKLARARERTGMLLIETSGEHHTVGVRASGLRLDLGGIGKGYALDRMAELLRDWSVERALVHSGESSVVAVGSPPGGDAWSLGLRDPADDARTIGAFRLRGGRSLSGSGRKLHGSHILDPRTGRPAEAALGAWAAAPSAALADALSTAFMVMSADEVAEYCTEHAEVSGMILRAAGEMPAVFGEWQHLQPRQP